MSRVSSLALSLAPHTILSVHVQMSYDSHMAAILFRQEFHIILPKWRKNSSKNIWNKSWDGT